uniref:Uncharacterized protein n=1 Tax=Heliothis virescens TaxID=7102 RepID=A0A2A4J5I2_HELVI
MGRQSDTTGERSGAGPTLTCSPMHGCINHQLPTPGCFVKVSKTHKAISARPGNRTRDLVLSSRLCDN